MTGRDCGATLIGGTVSDSILGGRGGGGGHRTEDTFSY